MYKSSSSYCASTPSEPFVSSSSSQPSQAGHHAAHGGASHHHHHQAKGEDALIARGEQSKDFIPSPSDGILLKSQLLSFMVSLSRRCFAAAGQPMHASGEHPLFFVDTVKNVRTIDDFKTAMSKVEQRLGYDCQLQSWPVDRQAWLVGLKIASHPSEILMLLRTMKHSMRPDAFESAHDKLVSQVRAAVNDLETLNSDAGYFHYPSECRELQLALLTKGIESVDSISSVGLRIHKARVLLTSSDGAAEAIATCESVIAIYSKASTSSASNGLFGPDLETALNLKETATKVLARTGSARTSASAATVKANLGIPAPKVTMPTDVNQLISTWDKLPESERDSSMTLPSSRLDNVLGSSVLRGRAMSALTFATLDMYRNPAPSTAPTGSPETAAARSPSPSLFAEVMSSVSKSRLVADALGQDLRTFETVLSKCVSDANSLAETLATILPENTPIEPLRLLPLPTQPSHVLMNLPASNASNAAWEKHVLSLKSTKCTFDSTSMTSGWCDSPLTESETPTLLFQEVYYLHPRSPEEEAAPTPNTPLTLSELATIKTKKGASDFPLITDMCSKLCYANSSSAASSTPAGKKGSGASSPPPAQSSMATYMGRSPLSSMYCSPACLLRTFDTNKTPLLWSPDMHLDGSKSIKVSKAEQSSMKPKQFIEALARQASMLPALKFVVSNLEDEESVWKRHMKACEEAKAAETVCVKMDVIKWANEQMRTCLAWTQRFIKQASTRISKGDAKFLETSASAGLKLFNMLNFTSEDELLKLYGQFQSLTQELFQNEWALKDARTNLASEKEKLDASSVLQRQRTVEEHARLQASVLSKQQSCAALEARVSDVNASLSSCCVNIHKRVGPKLLRLAFDLSKQLGAPKTQQEEEKFALALKDVTRFSVPAVEKAISDYLGDSKSTNAHKMKKAQEDIRSLLEVCSQYIASYPSTPVASILTPDSVSIEDKLRRLEESADEMRKLMAKWYTDHVVQRGYAQNLFTQKGLSYQQLNTIRNEINNSAARLKTELNENLNHEKWRRAEVLKHIHLRNQLLFSVVAECVLLEIRAAKLLKENQLIASKLLTESNEGRLSSKKQASTKSARIPTPPKAPVVAGEKKAAVNGHSTEPEVVVAAVAPAPSAEKEVVASAAPEVPVKESKKSLKKKKDDGAVAQPEPVKADRAKVVEVEAFMYQEEDLHVEEEAWQVVDHHKHSKSSGSSGRGNQKQAGAAKSSGRANHGERSKEANGERSKDTNAERSKETKGQQPPRQSPSNAASAATTKAEANSSTAQESTTSTTREADVLVKTGVWGSQKDSRRANLVAPSPAPTTSSNDTPSSKTEVQEPPSTTFVFGSFDDESDALPSADQVVSVNPPELQPPVSVEAPASLEEVAPAAPHEPVEQQPANQEPLQQSPPPASSPTLAPPIICPYFQQGTCRYGQNCRNSHVILASPPMILPPQMSPRSNRYFVPPQGPIVVNPAILLQMGGQPALPPPMMSPQQSMFVRMPGPPPPQQLLPMMMQPQMMMPVMYPPPPQPPPSAMHAPHPSQQAPPPM